MHALKSKQIGGGFISAPFSHFPNKACMGCLRLGIACLSMYLVNSVTSAAEGYQAVGQLVLTSFDKEGAPAYKNVLVFQVRVSGEKWVIRTEPLISKAGGIAFYESSNDTNNCVVKITSFKSTPDDRQSPIQAHRTDLLSNSELGRYTNYWSNPRIDSVTPPSTVSKALASSPKSQINNDGIAIVRQGKYPTADPSGCALLWHVFIPPAARNSPESERRLLQVWDDGHPNEIRFRQAEWELFSGAPQLVSNAKYFWKGKRLLANGNLEDLPGSNSNDALQLAARYVVSRFTNYSELQIPLEFTLTRFLRQENPHHQVVSTVVGSVVSLSKLDEHALLGLNITSNTFVNDYRLADRERDGAPFSYLLKSNSIPEVSTVTNSAAYIRHDRSLRENNSAKPARYIRVVMFVFVFAPLLLIGTLALRRRWRHPDR
jgi:hypothetical protein